VAAARAAFIVTKDPNDESRRLFLPVKNNLARLGAGLAFRLEQRSVGDREINTSSVVWASELVAISADQILQATGDQTNTGGRSALVEAEEFLKEMLAGGPVPVSELQAEVKAAGLSWATLRRAKNRLEVRSYRQSQGGDGEGHWYWSLQDAHPDARCSSSEGEHLAENEHLAVGEPI
jgi:hypothetical protein